jgi:hypothetical protein
MGEPRISSRHISFPALRVVLLMMALAARPAPARSRRRLKARREWLSYNQASASLTGRALRINYVAAASSLTLPGPWRIILCSHSISGCREPLWLWP